MDPSRIRAVRFVRHNWAWALLVPLLILVGELIHGGVELAAILIQGGRVFEVGELGHGRLFWFINFHYAPAPMADPLVPYVAPFAAWVWIAALGGVLLARLRPSVTARALLVACGLLPMTAISTALALGEAVAGQRALLAVVQERPLVPFLVAIPSFALFGAMAWHQFRRVWGGLSAIEFAAGYLAMLATPWLLLFVGR